MKITKKEQTLLDEAQKGCKTRIITDLHTEKTNAILAIDKKLKGLGIKKKDAVGMVFIFCSDDGPSSAYKYSYAATSLTLELTKAGYKIVEASRDYENVLIKCSNFEEYRDKVNFN